MEGIFCYLKMFSVLTSLTSSLQWDPLVYSRFKNKTVLLVFQLWQLEDFECIEISKYLSILVILKIALLSNILLLD